MIDQFRLTCSVTSWSYIIDKDIFERLNVADTHVKVSVENERLLRISVVKKRTKDESKQDFINGAHTCIEKFLMSLNVGTLGIFTFSEPIWLSPQYEFSDKFVPGTELGRVKGSSKTIDFEDREINSVMVDRVIAFYPVLMKEPDQQILSEYLKGLVHINSVYPGLDFDKEAFGNFYRAFENFVTARILKLRKLSNELKQISALLKNWDFEPDLIEEFEQLYKLRCEQVMHAQKVQNEVDRTAVFKMKVFTDLVIHEILLKQSKKLFGRSRK